MSEKLTDEQAQRLRAQVPDDAIPLPVGHLACEVCGIAVAVDVFAEAHQDPKRGKREPYTRCEDCRAMRETAQEFARGHPALTHRLGVTVALERIEHTLWALAVLGQQALVEDVSVMLNRLERLGMAAGFRSPTERARRECSPYPWAHVSISERAALRGSYGAALRDRLALSAPPVMIPCPSTACLMCGVAGVSRPAIEVSRRDGVELTQAAIWRAVSTSTTSLGGRPSPLRVRGHICPSCSDEVEAAGAVGWTACGQALVAYLGRTDGDRAAARLRARLASELPPAVPGWAVVAQQPNGEPWAHLGFR